MAHTSFHISKVIRQRLQLAESGNWIQLLRQYLEASRVNQTSVQRKFLEHSLSEPPSAERLREKAVNKAKQGNLHAARNILCGQIAAPLTPATATVVDALVAVEVPRCETSAQEKLFSDIRGMTAKFAPPKMRAIRRRLYSLNLGAESGPSGMRNAHVTCLARAHNGLVALQKWVRMWKAGEVSEDSALLWTSSIVVPIDCGSRQDGSRKLRPIALTEHMLKFTESVIIDECLPQLRGAFEPHQLGAGTADGNVLIYRILQTWLNDIESHGQVEPHAPVVEERNPSNDVLLGLDMENAYGRFFRSAALKATVARVPELAHLVLAEWGPGRTMYWQRIDGEWKISPTMRGGWQGSRLAMIMFCMSLEQSMDAMPQPVKDHVSRVGYQDDTYFVGNMYTLASEWDGVNEAFASGGHRLNGTKSSVFLPCWNDVPTAGMPQILQQWLAQICRSSNGLATMGCAAQGTFESALGPYQFALESARKRLDRASIFKDKLTELVATDTDDSTLHVAWLLTTKSLNQTLTYDARLLRPEVLAGVTGQLGSMVRTAVEHIMGRSLTGDAWEQLQLPGPLGGMGLRLPTVSSHAAYLSTWISCRDKVNLLCAALGRVAMNTVGEVDALASQAHLRAAGVEVRLYGEVTFTGPGSDTYSSGPWTQDCSAAQIFSHTPRFSCMQYGSGSKLHARIMRGLEAITATRLHAALPAYQQTVLLSCGGQGSGKFWSTIPGRPDHFMGNLHFKSAMSLRLGLVDVPDGAVCQIQKSTSAEGSGLDQCLCTLERDLQHPFLCKAGPARMRPHRSIAETLACEFKKQGAHVDLERACPDLCKVAENGHITEAILDVVYHLPGGPYQRKIDVTIRCPFAGRYSHVATRPGVAASGGVKDKLDRYGHGVICLSFETFGRLDPLSCDALRNLAADIEHRVTARPPSRRLYNKVRMSLERALLFEMADLALLSLGHSSGLNRRRRPDG